MLTGCGGIVNTAEQPTRAAEVIVATKVAFLRLGGLGRRGGRAVEAAFAGVVAGANGR